MRWVYLFFQEQIVFITSLQKAPSSRSGLSANREMSLFGKGYWEQSRHKRRVVRSKNFSVSFVCEFKLWMIKKLDELIIFIFFIFHLASGFFIPQDCGNGC
jgi:hypothetical protein